MRAAAVIFAAWYTAAAAATNNGVRRAFLFSNITTAALTAHLTAVLTAALLPLIRTTDARVLAVRAATVSSCRTFDVISIALTTKKHETKTQQ